MRKKSRIDLMAVLLTLVLAFTMTSFAVMAEGENEEPRSDICISINDPQSYCSRLSSDGEYDFFIVPMSDHDSISNYDLNRYVGIGANEEYDEESGVGFPYLENINTGWNTYTGENELLGVHIDGEELWAAAEDGYSSFKKSDGSYDIFIMAELCDKDSGERITYAYYKIPLEKAKEPIAFESEVLDLDMSELCNYYGKNDYDKNVYYTLRLSSGTAESFSSNNTSVARIPENDGISVELHLRKPGTATIRAYDENGHLAATCRLNVSATLKDIDIRPEGYEDYYDDYDYSYGGPHIAPGKTLQLKAYPCPSFAALPENINWTSSNPECAEVDENGLLTLVKRGPATIKAEAEVRTKVIEGAYGVKWSDSGKTEDGYSYRVTDDYEAEITGYDGDSREIVIPESMDGYTVSAIDYEAFEDCDNLQKVTIPKNIKSIGNRAFNSCVRLQTVVINSDADIPAGAFYYCPYLNTVEINGNPKSIGSRAFEECKRLSSIKLPEGLEEIGAEAFDYTGLKSLNLPASLKKIGEGAFNGASIDKLNIGKNVESIGKTGGVAEFNVAADNPNYSSKNGVLFNKKGDELILYPGESKEFHYSVPAGTVTIGEKAFGYCSSDYNEGIHQLDFPESLKTIEKSALPSNWDLEIVFPKSLKTVEEDNISYTRDGMKLYYKGSSADWDNIYIDYYNNDGLKNGNIIYNHKKTGLKLAQTSLSCTYAEGPKVKISYTDGSKVKYDDIIVYSQDRSIAYANADGYGGSSNNIVVYPKNKKGSVKLCVIAGGYAKDITVKVTGPTPLSKCNFTWDFVRWKYGNPVYSGKVQKPSFYLKTADGSSVYSEHYTYKYQNNKNVGTAKLIITGKNNCTGTITKTFSIVPDNTWIGYQNYGKNYITFYWSKNTKQTTGYQIQYGLKKDFKGAKTVWIKNNKTTKKKITGLKSKKVYYYRIRTYKKIGTKYYYSKWSSRYARKTK